MAKAALDPIPTDEPKDDSRLRESIRRIPKASPKKTESATWDTYMETIRDRPSKLDQHQVNYREAEKSYRCSGCSHFYIGVTAGRNVCEILRTDPEESIKPDWVCDFWNSDGEQYPLLKVPFTESTGHEED